MRVKVSTLMPPKKKATKKARNSWVGRNKDFLRVILKHGKNKKDIRKLMDLASRDEIAAISEVFYNALKGNVNLSPSAVKKIARHRRQIGQIVSKDVSLERKKRLLKGQTGGFLLPILSALGGAILGPIVKSIAGG